MGGLAFIGNLLVFRSHWMQRHNRRPKQTSGLLILNLAIADFLMSIYLLIIAISDQSYVDHYGVHAEEWLRSSVCSFAFFLGTLSSIMSVALILLISIDLYLCAINPLCYKGRNNNLYKFKVSVIVLWVICIIYVGIPAMTSTNASGNDRIYKYSSICMPSNVENLFYRSWIIIITVAIICIWLSTCLLYTLVLLKVRKSSRSVHKSSSHLDRKLAKKLSLILLTDLVSWLPYYLMIIRVILTGQIDIFELKFVIILALPVNSALNPYLYSFSCPTSQFKSLASFRTSISERIWIHYYERICKGESYVTNGQHRDPQKSSQKPDISITLNRNVKPNLRSTYPTKVGKFVGIVRMSNV